MRRSLNSNKDVTLQLPTELSHSGNPQRRWKSIPDPRRGTPEASVARACGSTLNIERRNGTITKAYVTVGSGRAGARRLPLLKGALPG